jgi:peptidyl-prolyl cis-trans isomerase D
MLQLIREKVTGWIAALIVGLLIIPFAFWGINAYFEQGGNVTAAVVNGTDITLQEYQQAYQNVRQQWQNSTGGGVPAEQEEALKRRSIDSLIERELLNQVNASAGLRVSDRQLGEAIKNLSYFQGISGFDNDIYARTLAQAGLTAAGFEQQMRQDFATDQLQKGLVATAFITGSEVHQIARMLNQKRDFQYATLSSDELKETTAVTDEEIQQYYAFQGQQFMEPEQVRIAYIDLSLNDIAEEVTFNEADLQEYYEANKANYDLDEQRKYKQLFIATGLNAGEAEITRARQQAQQLLDRIHAGTPIDELGNEQDEQEPFFEKMEIDFMTRGIIEPEVDEVLFSLNEGEISDLIETESGIQIIQVEEIKGGNYSTFTDVRDQVAMEYRLEHAETRYFELADQLATLTFENPDTLSIASEDLGLPIQESPYFSRQQQDSDLLRNPEIIEASFGEEVMIAQNNSEPIELDNDRLVVLRVIDHKPAIKKPLSEVREQIITRLKYEHARDLTREKGEEIIQALNNNASREEIAARYGIAWSEKTGIGRDDTTTNLPVLQTAFSLGKPDTDKPVIGGTSLATGDYVVIMVTDVHEPDLTDIEQEQLDAIKSQLLRLTATNTWYQLINTLRENAAIRIYENNL